jgi:uncharacterized membrane protein YeaQ/YmgE (transglycosylase-associated protein family)
MSGQGLLVILLVGLIAGWLAGQIVRGTGFGLVADLCIGIIGALIGSWLLPALNIHLGNGIAAAIISATIGAILLLVILRLVRAAGAGDRLHRCRWTPQARVLAHARSALRTSQGRLVRAKSWLTSRQHFFDFMHSGDLAIGRLGCPCSIRSSCSPARWSSRFWDSFCEPTIQP